MSERTAIPRNGVGQPPTRTPEATKERLEEKERAQRGGANRDRTDRQIDEVRSDGPREQSR
jgi:hypothetical protein